jgi:hypothetical protein
MGGIRIAAAQSRQCLGGCCLVQASAAGVDAAVLGIVTIIESNCHKRPPIKREHSYLKRSKQGPQVYPKPHRATHPGQCA